MTKYYGTTEGGEGALVRYDSMKEFDEILKAEHHISGRERSSENKGDHEWAGTYDWEEAERLRKYGDSKSLKLLSKTKAVTDKAFEKFAGKKIKNFDNMAGFMPIVPNALKGLPLSMLDQERTPKKIRTVNILYNCSEAASTDKEDLALRGAFTLSVINALEREGYRVNLYVGDVSMLGDRPFGSFINLKHAENPLNLRKIAYYLGNPSFLRRTCFRICENESFLPDATNCGYGRNCDFETQQNFIRKYTNIEHLVIVDATVKIRRSKPEEENVKLICKPFKGIIDFDGED